MKNEPWFREFDGWWYVYVRKNGKRRQIKLAQGKENKVQAYERWVALGSRDANLGLSEEIGLVAKTGICFAMGCCRNRRGHEIRRLSMESSQGGIAEAASTTRRYRSPNRILARSFRIGRDKWKDKHHAVQATQ